MAVALVKAFLIGRYGHLAAKVPVSTTGSWGESQWCCGAEEPEQRADSWERATVLNIPPHGYDKGPICTLLTQIHPDDHISFLAELFAKHTCKYTHTHANTDTDTPPTFHLQEEEWLSPHKNMFEETSSQPVKEQNPKQEY